MGGSTESESPTLYPATDGRVARLTDLEETLTRCRTDIMAREEFATLLERLGQHGEALFNWQAVLACDANNLKARGGIARCRQRTGRPLQSPM